MGTRAIVRLLLATIATLWSTAAEAHDRPWVIYDRTDGLQNHLTNDVTQDRDGVIWVANQGGVARFDGLRFHAVAKDELEFAVIRLGAAPDGSLWAVDSRQVVLHIVDEHAEEIETPETITRSLIGVDDAGNVFVIGESGLLRRRPDGTWDRPLEGLGPHGKTSTVVARSGSPAMAATEAGIFAVGDEVERIAPGTIAWDLLREPDGSVWVLPYYSNIKHYRGDELLREVDKAPSARPIALARRGETVWVAYDNVLQAIHPDGSTDETGRPHGPTGGTMHVDHEGSLWLTSHNGIRRFPEPDTISFGRYELERAPSPRVIVGTANEAWYSTWGGAGRIERQERAWVSQSTELRAALDGLCFGLHGEIWITERGWSHDLTVIEPDGATWTTPNNDHITWNCLADPERDTIWFPGTSGLQRLDGDALVDVPYPRESSFAVDVDVENRLWVLQRSPEPTVCHIDVDHAMLDIDGWTCERLPTQGEVWNVVAEEDRVWVAIQDASTLMIRDDDGWHTFPDRVTPGGYKRLARSGRGGIWVTMPDRLERRDPVTREVLETVGAWHGVLDTPADDIYETPEGHLWIAGLSTVYRVPAHARQQSAGPPQTRVLNSELNGAPVDVNDTVEVPAGPNQLSFDFVATSYRDPSRIRYRVRVGDRDPTRLSSPSLTLVDLEPGAHRVEIESSLDGETWSDPVVILIDVELPWYLRPWFAALVVVIGSTILWITYRIRIARITALARQRERIAMDLHDELGSGLGSIGLLAGVLQSRDLPALDRTELTEKIADTAQGLGQSLRGIVRALRPDGGTAEALARNVQVRAAQLFPSAGDTKFELRVPERWPTTELSLPVRRAAELIAVEAMHNAAKHAQAGRVEIGIVPRGGRWHLWVHDDGRGFREGSGDGVGLESMQRRAGRMGATLQIESDDLRGTRVDLYFQPDAPDRG